MLRLLSVCLVSIPILLSGCAEPMPEFGQVTGVVKANNKPLKGVAVTFMPDPEKGNNWAINASGTTDDQGKYTLRYGYKGQQGEGTPIGWNRVMLMDTRYSSIPQGAPLPPRWFSTAYSSPGTTPLAFEVKPGAQTIDLDVK